MKSAWAQMRPSKLVAFPWCILLRQYWSTGVDLRWFASRRLGLLRVPQVFCATSSRLGRTGSHQVTTKPCLRLTETSMCNLPSTFSAYFSYHTSWIFHCLLVKFWSLLKKFSVDTLTVLFLWWTNHLCGSPFSWKILMLVTSKQPFW